MKKNFTLSYIALGLFFLVGLQQIQATTVRRISVTEEMDSTFRDSVALVDFYLKANGANWTNNAGWLSDNLANWYGVKMVAGRVTELILPSNNLNGSITDSIGNLTYLKNLSLQLNKKLKGTIPVSIGKLSLLETFNLYNDSLSGKLPEEVYNLYSLRTLNLCANSFSDTVSASISNLQNAILINLSNNHFTGLKDINSDVFPNLELLKIDYNHLKFTDIDCLYSFGYKVDYTPQLPFDSAATFVQGEGNPFVFEVKDLLEPGSTYQWYKNKIKIAGAVNSAYPINLLSIRDSGEYYCEVRNQSLVKDFYLYTDNVKLVITPNTFIDSLALVDLYNSTNGDDWQNKTGWLTSPLKDWYGVSMESGRVTALNLAKNNLDGTLPNNIGNLIYLKTLLLSSNFINGSIPASIGNLTSLESLNLYNNEISGAIPNELFQLPELKSLNMAYNYIRGAFPTTFNSGISSKLLLVDISENYLSSLPVLDLTQTPNLEMFNVAKNTLTFDALVPNIPIGSKFRYYPQDSIAERKTIDSLFERSAFTYTLELNELGNTYRWYFNGILLSGQTSRTLSIPSLKITDSGKYICIINNSLVDDDSSLVRSTIQLNVKPDSLADRNALIALYNATNGANWSNNTNWLDPNVSIQDWHGVEVIGGRVRTLILDNNGLIGTIPPEIGSMEYLQTLNLSGNILKGTIPSEIGNLKELASLNLSQDSLFGSIPKNIYNLGKLTSLNLSYNNLTDTIHSEISMLKSLVYANFSSNNLTELDYMNAVNFTKLELINVSENKLTFEDIRNVFSLKDKFVYDPQQLIDNPEAIVLHEGDAINISTSLTEKDVYYKWYIGNTSLFSDSTLSTYNAFASLSDAGIYYCEIRAKDIPDLVLERNDIYITVMPNIEIDSLVLVNFYKNTSGANWTNKTNWLSGALNTWYGVTLQYGRVVGLELPNNNLVGNLQDSIGRLFYLQRLDLSNNSLTDTIPESLGNLNQLTIINLRHNYLTGNFTFGSNPNLTSLDLSNNNLSGTIPSKLSNQAKLIVANYSTNNFDSIAPQNLANMPDLKLFAVDNNNLIFDDLEPLAEYASLLYSPQMPIQMPEDITINEFENLTLHGKIAGVNNTYSWTKDFKSISQTTDSITITNADASASGYYVCTVSNDILPKLTLSSKLISVSVKINILPPVVDIPYPYCIGDSVVVLRKTPDTRTTEWSTDPLFLQQSEIIQADKLRIVVKNDDVDYYAVNTGGGWKTDPVHIPIILRPTIENNNGTLKVKRIVNDASYQWIFNNSVVATGTEFTPTAKGIYYVIGKYGVCESSSTPFSVSKRSENTFEGESLSNSEFFTIFPNPFKSFFNVNFTGTDTGTAQLSVYNSIGQMVFNKTYNKARENLYISEAMDRLSAGIYSVTLRIASKTYSKKMIKE